MKKFPVVLDLETKYTFREFEEAKKLGVTVVGVYDYKTNESRIYMENELPQLFTLLEHASYVIGYNVISFDLQVLQGYYPGNVTQFAAFDILEDIKNKIGRRLGLNDVISATLGKKKTGHGLMAIDYYKEGKWDELKKYCLDDALLTKELFDFGLKSGEIYYVNERGKTPIKVDWRKYMEDEGTSESHLTLPF